MSRGELRFFVQLMPWYIASNCLLPLGKFMRAVEQNDLAGGIWWGAGVVSVGLLFLLSLRVRRWVLDLTIVAEARERLYRRPR